MTTRNHNLYACDICNKTYTNRQNLWRHGKSHDKNVKNLSTKMPQNTTGLPQNTTNLPQNPTKMCEYTCQYCNKSLSRHDSLKRHEVKCKISWEKKQNILKEENTYLKEALNKQFEENTQIKSLLTELLNKNCKVHPKTLQKINKQLNGDNNTIKEINKFIEKYNFTEVISLLIDGLNENKKKKPQTVSPQKIETINPLETYFKSECSSQSSNTDEEWAKI